MALITSWCSAAASLLFLLILYASALGAILSNSFTLFV